MILYLCFVNNIYMTLSLYCYPGVVMKVAARINNSGIVIYCINFGCHTLSRSTSAFNLLPVRCSSMLDS